MFFTELYFAIKVIGGLLLALLLFGLLILGMKETK